MRLCITDQGREEIIETRQRRSPRGPEQTCVQRISSNPPCAPGSRRGRRVGKSLGHSRGNSFGHLPQELQSLAQKLRRTDKVQQRDVEPAQRAASVADVTILEYRGSAQVFDRDRLADE